MPKTHNVEIKVACRRDYVESRLALPQIAELRNVTRQTLAKWRSEGAWDRARENYDATPDQIGDRLKKEISDLLVEIDDIKAAGGSLSDILIKRIDTLSKTLARLDNTYYSKAMMIKWANTFVDFLVGDPKGSAVLPIMKELMPKFIDHIERQV